MTEAAAAQAGTEQTSNTEQSTNTEGQSANQSWYGEIPADDVKYLEAKGWTGSDAPPKIFQSYKNLEQLFSKVKGDPNRVLMMPKDMSNPDETREFYSKLGVPADAKDYELGEDGKLADYANLAHKLNMTKDQAKGVVEWVTQLRDSTEAEKAAEFEHESKLQLEEWRREKGATYDEALVVARQAYHVFPELKEQAAELEKVMGTKKFMNFVHSVGSRIGEAGSAGASGSQSFGMTPAQAKSAIQEFNADSGRRAALITEDHPGHQAAKAEWQRLHNFAYPEYG